MVERVREGEDRDKFERGFAPPKYPAYERLEAENTRLRTALEPYANPLNWRDLSHTEGSWFTGDWSWDGETGEPWKIALAALTTTEGS